MKPKETRLTIELDPDLKNEAKSKAYQEGKTLKIKIIELLRVWLKRKE